MRKIPDETKIPRPVIEQIAWNLSSDTPSPVAFLQAEKTVYFSSRPVANHRPHSCVTDLIQGIYSSRPEMARKILRNRIFTTSAPTEMCLGMVRVAAKRLSGDITPKDHGLRLPLRLEKLGLPEIENSITREEQSGSAANALSEKKDFMSVTQDLASAIQRGPLLRQSDRAVAAVLVDQNDRILHWALNSNSRNRTLHAEVNLLQGYFKKTGTPLPPDSRIFVSLKPCKMCAGMIWRMAADPTRLQVIFGENDPGPGARGTILDLGSNERGRWARSPAERAVPIQSLCP